MLNSVRGSIQGFVKIIDKTTGEILVDTHNDVLYGNIASALAHSLLGSPQSLLAYIAFGNGGAYVSPTGTILYKPSLGGNGSLVKLPTANLYNTIFVKKVTNYSSVAINDLSKAYIPTENNATNYEDIVVDVTMGFNEPTIGITSSSIIQQLPLDNSIFIGTASPTSGSFDPTSLVFNEIGLFAGTDSIFAGEYTTTVDDVTDFINQGVDFSNVPGTMSKLMLTHVIFHPIQKSANRTLEIIYTLRIQMGAA